MDLSIVIVSWNSEDWLRRCLESIFKETSEISFEVIVVDNASEDESVRVAMNEFGNVKVIENKLLNSGMNCLAATGPQKRSRHYSQIIVVQMQSLKNCDAQPRCALLQALAQPVFLPRTTRLPNSAAKAPPKSRPEAGSGTADT